MAASGAQAASRVQWLGEIPPADVRQQAERSSGPATHLDASELGWPVQPEVQHQARKAMVELRRALSESQGRWEAFDVEKDIAWRLGEAIAALPIVESEVERELAWRLLLLQGAAVHWAWSPQERERSPDAASYLVEMAGERLYAPWVDAVALFPEREPSRDLLPDMASFHAFVRQRDHLVRQRPAELTAQGLPSQAVVVLDGEPLDAHALPREITAGRHWVHLDRGGVVAAAHQVRLGPGERLDFDGLVLDEDLERAGERVLAGNLLAIPEPVKQRVEQLRAETPDEPYYLAAWAGRGPPQVYGLEGADPWLLGEYDRPIALLADLSLGVGVVSSTAFAEASGEDPHASAAALLDLGVELAWRRWGGIFEIGIHDTGGRATIAYDSAQGDETTTSAITRVSLAPAFYVLRLRPRRPHFVVAVPLALGLPAHSGAGAQAWFGFPLGQTTWLRVGADLWKGNELPDYQADGVNNVLNAITFRVGVAQKAY